MGKLVQRMDQRFYPQHRDNWDDWLFRDRIKNYIKPTSVVLDIGAGAGIVEQMRFKGLARKICGVDLDPRVEDNPYLDEGKLSDAGALPYQDNQFDLVFSDNVLEHLASPGEVFREIFRVLRPDGHFLFKTPNKWHYMPVIARVTPHWFHATVNRWRGRDAEDVFPTLYRANSKTVVKNLAVQTGFEMVRLERIEGRPEYLRLSAPTYLAGLAYERLVNSSNLFEPFRILLVGTLRKGKGA